MKKIIIILIAATALFSFTQCNKSAADMLHSNADSRAKVIAELMDNDTYMNEVMVAMKTKHREAIASTSLDMMKDDKKMKTKMMGHMFDMSMTDSTMCKMMMEKTMAMCDMDKSKCSMMMDAMKKHPKGMQSMKDMGMCTMKGMDMSKMK